ncbi:MAG TPA: SBBP repeat-containing protein, partial [Bacteroidia bacterium]|nr:SBBP repeat-containing protein [Bacteroidia bacterium]
QLGGTSSEIGFSIAFDQEGNVYTTGLFQGSGDFDPGAGAFILSAVGGNDVFISKLDSAGNFLWAKAMGSTSDDRATSIATDPSGNVYTTGYFEGTMDFDPGAGTFNLTAGLDDAFISKLDSSGNFIWVKQIGSTSLDGGRAITIDAWGNIYTAGEFEGTVDFDPGTGTYNLIAYSLAYDAFILKLDSAGNFVWAKQLGGTSVDVINAIAVDGPGNVYTTGVFFGTSDFDPGASTFNLTPSGGEDLFISKLDSAGNFVWAGQIGGSSNDIGASLILDSADNIYVAGYFLGICDFDPAPGIFNLTSAGDYDFFTVKMSQEVFTGGNENDFSASVSTFPNPSGGQVNLSFGHSLNHATILLFNTTGQKVMEKENVSGNQFDLDFSSLPDGIYFIKMVGDDKIAGVKKIIKQ